MVLAANCNKVTSDLSKAYLYKYILYKYAWYFKKSSTILEWIFCIHVPHNNMHLLPYHLHKAFFVHNLKDLVPQIAPHFSPPFLLPLPKEQVSHFLIQLFTALVTRNLFLPLGGRVGRFLVVFFCGCDFFPTFFNAGLEDSSKKTSW